MPDDLWEAAAVLRSVLERFDPGRLSERQCASAVSVLVATEKACAAARARAAARAVEHGVHRDQGFADGVDWLANKLGSTNGEARLAIETARAMEACPKAKAALLSGELSLAQTGVA